jgi:IMP dehydrogenase
MSLIKEGLTFDDVLLVPQHSDIPSRSDVDLSVKFDDFEFAHPIIPANMKNVTGKEMALEICKSGGLAILHRFMPVDEQIEIANELSDAPGSGYFALSLGVKDNDREYAMKFADHGIRIVCVDIAHGDSEQCINMVKWLKKETNFFVIAGNVATAAGASRLWEAGADVVKVGIGPGSLCTTRIKTGNGVPQLTALMEVREFQQVLERLEQTKYPNQKTERRKFPFIADGGIKDAGDMVKALCFADMVMAGNVFAGCEEAPGKTLTMPDGFSYKEYAGSSTHKANHIEGVVALVPTKGKYKDILIKLLEDIRSGCSYQGAHNIKDLRDNPEFIRITNAGLKESHPHDVRVTS